MLKDLGLQDARSVETPRVKLSVQEAHDTGEKACAVLKGETADGTEVHKTEPEHSMDNRIHR